jgi:hypothetical protein
VIAARFGFEGGERQHAIPGDFSQQPELPGVIALTFPLAIEFQSLDDGVLNLLRGCTRGEKPVDFISRDFELLYLIGFFLLHDGTDHALI